MEKTFYYPFVPGYYGTRPLYDITSPAKRFIKKVDSFPETQGLAPLKELDDEKIVDLLRDVELLDNSLRSCLSSTLFDGTDEAGLLEKLWTDVCVYEHPNMEFLMCFPYLVGCSYRNGEYGIARRVSYQLKHWFQSHSIPKYGPDNPLMFAYKRFVCNGDTGICDNDNIEMRRITNSVVYAMGGTDKPLMIDFMYTTRIADTRGVELAVFRKSEFACLSDYYLKDTPEHPECASFFYNTSYLKKDD